MNVIDHIPTNAENQEYDVIVVGTGMGGAALGFELSRLGRKVLFVEKGKFLQRTNIYNQAPEKGCSESEARLLNGRWPDRLNGKTTFGPVKFFGPLGCGTGGSTLLYGAQLERFQPSDFTPKKHFRSIGASTLPEEWPITYDEMLPFYRKAEKYLKICGTQDPLNPDSQAPLKVAPALSDRDQFIFNAMEQSGLNPYRSHVGYHNIQDCWECLDLCFKECKSDAGTRFLLPAILHHGAKILPECEVNSLESNQKSIQHIYATKEDKQLKLTAKVVVLAAGAYMTPTLLLRSHSPQWREGLANGSGLVGRNLMLHTSDLIMIDQAQHRDATGPVKSITLNDFYLDEGQKLGTVQSVGLRPLPPYILSYMRFLVEKDPAWLERSKKYSLHRMAKMLTHRFRNSSIFSTIVEDLPYMENGIQIDKNSPNGFRFNYTYTKELRKRNQILLQLISKSLEPHLTATVVTGSENNLNFGHVCGTCRFGNDPKTSVLDANNKAHELENLYVVDASFFPSSAGTNPSLTIAANALRVGEAINKQFDSSEKMKHD